MPDPINQFEVNMVTELIMEGGAFYSVKDDVIGAIREAQDKHGYLPSNPCRQIVILGEEFGESCKEVLEGTRGLASVPGAMDRAYTELGQLAAVAIRMMVRIKATNVKHRQEDRRASDQA